jgi:4-amino-4-deoxy-L-arabinose transferase-like glycosyltransferase
LTGLRRRRLLAAGLLAAGALLAFGSLRGDSLTFDEPYHLAAGLSYWRTDDYRFAQATPPLVQRVLALPLVLAGAEWPGPDAPGWREGDVWEFVREWASEEGSRRRTLHASRLVAVVFYLATCLATAALARRCFGEKAGGWALALAVLSPTLLAHGRLATIDTAMALGSALVLLALARLIRRPTLLSLAAVAAALAALAVTKFTWPLVLPAVFAMGAAALWQDRGWRTAARAGAAGGALAMVVVLAIWSQYGWRYQAVADDHPESRMRTALSPGDQAPTSMEETWALVLSPRGGGADAVRSAVGVARRHRLLPEAYLFGIAHTRRATGRGGYLRGEISPVGWRSYFPIAFLVKTPLPSLLLIGAGVLLVLARRVTVRDPVLLLGAGVFVLSYSAAAIGSAMNIGHRHLLPLYPPLLAMAAATAAATSSRTSRLLLGGAVAWLAVTTLSVHPHYLSYFNEAAGGWTRGHRWLADSNVDWGQDLWRLAAHAREHEEEPLRLMYFGSVRPDRYGFEVQVLAGPGTPEPLPPLEPGTYVLSVTHLLGIYDPRATDSFWARPSTRRAYHEARSDPEEVAARRVLERGRLVCALRRRPPDDRVGASLWVYRVTAAELEAALAP